MTMTMMMMMTASWYIDIGTTIYVPECLVKHKSKYYDE